METRSVRFKHEHRAQNALKWLFAGVVGLLLVLFVLFVWFSPVYVADESMTPTLVKGDTIFYDRLYAHVSAYERGNMVVFRDPQSGQLLIKRIVALEGETIEAKDGELVIDGKYGMDEHRYHAGEPLDFSRIKVPEGCVFVLSDDRNYGEDSRNPSIGCLPASDILGIVRFRLREFKMFTN